MYVSLFPGVLMVGLQMDVYSNKPLIKCTRDMLLCSERVNILCVDAYISYDIISSLANIHITHEHTYKLQTYYTLHTRMTSCKHTTHYRVLTSPSWHGGRRYILSRCGTGREVRSLSSTTGPSLLSFPSPEQLQLPRSTSSSAWVAQVFYIQIHTDSEYLL